MRDKYADIPVQFKQQHFDKIREYKDKLYTLIDSKGLPFSHPLSPTAHEWNIQKL